MIRTDRLSTDGIANGTLGYCGAHAVNFVRGATLFSPLHAALLFGGEAVLERCIYSLSSRIIPKYRKTVGRIPLVGRISLDARKVVSHGVAFYTIVKIMKVAGLITTVPPAVTTIGVTCLVAFTVFTYLYFRRPVLPLFKTPEMRLEKTFSKTPGPCQLVEGEYLSGLCIRGERGDFSATNSQFGQLFVEPGIGSNVFTDCKMTKEVITHQNFAAFTSQFEGDFFVCAGNTNLSNCTVDKNVYVFAPTKENSDSPARLVLSNTTVKGDIIFESGEGEVFKKGDDKILGRLVGVKAMTSKESDQ